MAPIAPARAAALLMGLASGMKAFPASGEHLFLFQLGFGEGSSVDHTVVESFGTLLGEDTPDRPEWCVNETSLTWKQRKERAQQQATLQWSKQQVKRLRANNDTVPVWMDIIVSADENRGRMKWAVTEAKRLKDTGAEVPDWMKDLVEENDKWANRWAACRSAELKAQGEEVPTWMIENGRNGIMDYSTEKSTELQRQIDELSEMQSKEEALVQAGGQIKLAKQRIKAKAKQAASRSPDQQLHVLEIALAALGDTEQMLRQNHNHAKPGPKVKQAMAHVKDAYETLGRILQPKLESIIHGK